MRVFWLVTAGFGRGLALNLIFYGIAKQDSVGSVLGIVVMLFSFALIYDVGRR